MVIEYPSPQGGKTSECSFLDLVSTDFYTQNSSSRSENSKTNSVWHHIDCYGQDGEQQNIFCPVALPLTDSGDPFVVDRY